jgi:hypothetical protein
MTVCGVPDIYWKGTAIVFCILLLTYDDMRNIRRTTMLVKTRCYHYDLNYWAITFKVEDCRPTLEEDDARHMRTCPTFENPMNFPTSPIHRCQRGTLSCALYHKAMLNMISLRLVRQTLSAIMQLEFEIGYDDHSGRRIQSKKYVNERIGSWTWYEASYYYFVYHKYNTGLHRDRSSCREVVASKSRSTSTKTLECGRGMM